MGRPAEGPGCEGDVLEESQISPACPCPVAVEGMAKLGGHHQLSKDGSQGPRQMSESAADFTGIRYCQVLVTLQIVVQP